MKIEKELIVIKDSEENSFLAKIEPKEYTLAASYSYSDDIEKALTTTPDAYERQKDKVDAVAVTAGGQIVKVKAVYEVTTLDGQEVEEIDEDKVRRDRVKSFLEDLLGDD